MNNNYENKDYKCDICNVIRTGQLNWQMHLNSLTHLCKRGKILRSLFVYDLPINVPVNDIVEYFQNFGTLNNVYVDEVENLMIIECANRNMVRHILKTKQHKVKGEHVNVCYKHPDLVESTVEPQDISPVEVLMNIMNSQQNDIEGQLNCLVTRWGLSKEQEKLRLLYCQTLETRLRGFFPGCNLFRFGPTVNGTGTKGCDMDLFLDLNIMPYLKPMSERSIDFSFESTKKMLSYVQRKKDKSLFLLKVYKMEPVNVIELLSEILKSYIPGCYDVFSQSSARCPVVRFRCEELEINCDISVNSGLSVQNSLLMAFYQSYDRRVRLLCYAVHFWAKRKGLLDRKSGGFSKYALTMMVIHFLQSCNPPVLPTLAKLQHLEEDELVCNGWNCQFSMNALPPMHPNKLPINSLLLGFFSFYQTLDLSQNVILLRSADVMNKEDFSRLMQRDSELKKKFGKFQLQLVAIQDPFELNRNIAANITEDGYSKWIRALEDLAAITDKSFPVTRISDKLWGICALLVETCFYDTPITSQPITCTNYQFKALLGTKCCFCFSRRDDENTGLVHTEACTIKAAQTIKEIIRRALLFQIQNFPFATPDDDDKYLALTPSDAFVDPQKTGYLLDTFVCQAFMNTWTDRRVARRQVLKSSAKRRQQLGGTLGAEEAVSRKMTLLRRTHSAVPLCTFICSLHSYVETTNDRTGVLVQLRAANFIDSNIQTKLISFLNAYIPMIMNRIINENGPEPLKDRSVKPFAQDGNIWSESCY